MSAAAERSDARTRELVDRIHRGDEQAWSELYRSYRDELLFTVRMSLGARLRGALESEDVLQSVALEAFQALPDFEYRGQGSLRAFLHRLVIHKIRDRADTFGAQKRSGAVPLTDTLEQQLQENAPATYDGGADGGAEYLRLEKTLALLPDEMCRVILLRKLEGLSSQEAANRLGKSDAATRKLFSRAMAKLSLLLEGAASP